MVGICGSERTFGAFEDKECCKQGKDSGNKCIAEYEGRSANREIEVLIKRYVAEFEKKNGKIEVDWEIPGEKGQ